MFLLVADAPLAAGALAALRDAVGMLRPLVATLHPPPDARLPDPCTARLARTAYDLRGPLTAVRGYAEGLHAGMACAEIDEAREVLLRASDDLVALVDRLAALAVAGLLVAALWFAKPSILAFGNWNLPLFLGLFAGGLLAVGVPIAFCFALATLGYLTFATNAPIFVMMGRIDEGMSSLILLSVPVFVLLGCILDATGMGRAIVGFLASLFGHVKAGMSYVLLGSMFLVSGISGSKVSDMATVAPALFP